MTRRIFALGAGLLLAGCMSNTVAKAPAEPNPYTVTSVRVNLVEGAEVKGRFADEALRKSVLAKIEATATERARAVPGGPAKARAVINVTGMQLRDAGARAFGGVNAIYGQMTIVNSKGAVLKGPVGVAHADQARNNGSSINGIPIGLLINAGRNSADQESGKDVDVLVSGFADKVAAGL